jgi:hypothetical protein
MKISNGIKNTNELFVIIKISGLQLLRKIGTIWLLIYFCIAGFHCKKNNSGLQLPAITQEGKNTFGCKIDGKVWIPSWPCVDIVGGTAEINYNIVPVTQSVSLPLVWVSLLGNYKENESTFFLQQAPTLSDHLIYHEGNIIDSIKIVFSTAPFNMYQNYYYAGNTSPRYFNITKLDTLNKIISGAFAFTLYGQNGLGGTDSVVITEGRFDFMIGSYSRCSN